MSESGLPKYLQIEQSIIDIISKGILNAGDMLESETSLAEKYGVSRVTVRKALNKLVQKGYIYKVHGKGSIVADRSMMIKSPTLKSFTAEMTEEGIEVKTLVKVFNIVEVSDSLAKILKISKNNRAFYIERMRYGEDKPMMFERTFMDLEKHSNLTVSVLESSKLEYAYKQKMNISYSDQIVDAILATKYIADLLAIDEGSPIIRVKNTTYLDDGNIFDYTELFMHPDNYSYMIRKEV